MARRIPLISVDDLAEGCCMEVAAEGRIFAVCRVNGQFHVFDGICPHAGGPLGKGTLQGCIVTCPWHGWQFDVTTGRHQLSDTICQTVYEAAVEDGRVVITIDQ